MNSNQSGHLLVKRGLSIVNRNPTTDDVVSLMTTIEAENGMDGPPDLDLEYSLKGESGQERQCDLLLMLAFHQSKAPRWIADFRVPKSPSSSLLASRPVSRDDFEVRTCCGVVMNYRVECLLNNSSTIRQAIDWFLKHKAMCPNLAWIDYDDAVRDP